MKIHIFGSSGSGTSTLGRLLSREFKWPVFDADDYYWKKTEPPYTQKNEINERYKLLLDDLKGPDNWIISGSMDSWCEPFKQFWDLAIFIECNEEIRVNRLKSRELLNFGKRIQKGGDMFDEHEFFIKWARQYEDGSLGGRSRSRHELFIKELSCPVIRLTNEGDLDQLLYAAKNAIDSFQVQKNT